MSIGRTILILGIGGGAAYLFYLWWRGQQNQTGAVLPDDSQTSDIVTPQLSAPSSTVPASNTFDYLVYLADQAADKYGIDRDLYHALINQESRWVVNAQSKAGAKGLTQFTDTTAAQYGITNPFDPAQSLDAGARYLSDLIKKFNSIPLALAAYNAGAGNVLKYGGIPPFKETQNYVKIIMQNAGI